MKILNTRNVTIKWQKADFEKPIPNSKSNQNIDLLEQKLDSWNNLQVI